MQYFNPSPKSQSALPELDEIFIHPVATLKVGFFSMKFLLKFTSPSQNAVHSDILGQKALLHGERLLKRFSNEMFFNRSSNRGLVDYLVNQNCRLKMQN